MAQHEENFSIAYQLIYENQLAPTLSTRKLAFK